jgi:hypothetical protein
MEFFVFFFLFPLQVPVQVCGSVGIGLYAARKLFIVQVSGSLIQM